MQGITEWTTPQGVHVLRIHYTADPNKQSEDWKKEQKRGMTQAAWEREYEINFHVHPGKPFYDEFRMEFHIASEPLKPIPGRPILRGWDYGLTPATAFAQTTAKGQVLFLFPELYSFDAGINEHGQVVSMESQIHFPGYSYIDVGDPAGNSKSQNDKKTANDILREKFNIRVIAGEVTLTGRAEAMRDALTSMTSDGEPKILIDPRLAYLIGGFTGGYHRKEVAGVLLNEPEKNEYSHLMNAAEYIVAYVFKQTGSNNKWDKSKSKPSGAL